MQRFFTLIELLIVVAILGVLLSVLFPSLRQAKEKGRRAVCISNMSQISKILFSHMKENDYRTPPEYHMDRFSFETLIGKNGETNYTSEKGLNIKNRILNKYIKPDASDNDEIELAKCPSTPEVYHYRGTSYGLNNGFQKNDITELDFIYEVVDPARMVLIHESGVYFRWRDNPIGNGLSDASIVYGHTSVGDDRWYMGFVDGSLKGLFRVMYNLDWTEKYTLNNNF